MSTRFPAGRWLFAGALLAVATAGMAEVPPRNAVPVKITPEMIRQASAAVQPTQGLPSLPTGEYQAHDVNRDTPAILEHIPNGCSRKGGSLCYDYRTGHAVYKPMRKLLPEIPGMTSANLSVHRDKIVAEYSFK